MTDRGSPGSTDSSAEHAGGILRARRRALGLSSSDVVGRSTVPSKQYLDRLEAGVVHVARSKHLSSLVDVLSLPDSEVQLLLGLNPTEQRAREIPELDLFRPEIFSSASILTGLRGRVAVVLPDPDGSLPDGWTEVIAGTVSPPRGFDMLTLIVQVGRVQPVPGCHYIIRRPGHLFERALAITSSSDDVLLLVGSTAVKGDDAEVFAQILREVRSL